MRRLAGARGLDEEDTNIMMIGEIPPSLGHLRQPGFVLMCLDLA